MVYLDSLCRTMERPIRTATIAAQISAKSIVLSFTGRVRMWDMVVIGSHSFVADDAGNIGRPVPVIGFEIGVQFLQGFVRPLSIFPHDKAGLY